MSDSNFWGAVIVFLLLVAVGLLFMIATEPRDRIHADNELHAITPSAAPQCPQLSNPCDRINCNRPNTKGIA